jgi:ubiquinone/menaquinone biosynthesis C-methylase UbiE
LVSFFEGGQMKIDKIELRFMNTPIRGFFQRYLEFKIFKELLIKSNVDLTKKVILDAGCGAGYSTELILEEFKPKELFAFDSLSEEIELAKQRRLLANLFIGSITDIKLLSEKFDGVFVCFVLRHVPEWRKALKEVSRVLKPGGILLVEEASKQAIDWVEHFLGINHPKEARFDWSEFVEELERAGFNLIEYEKFLKDRFRSFLCKKKIT